MGRVVGTSCTLHLKKKKSYKFDDKSVKGLLVNSIKSIELEMFFVVPCRYHEIQVNLDEDFKMLQKFLVALKAIKYFCNIESYSLAAAQRTPSPIVGYGMIVDAMVSIGKLACMARMIGASKSPALGARMC